MKGEASFKFPTGEHFKLEVGSRTSFGHPQYRISEPYLLGTIPQYAMNFVSLMTPFLHILGSFDAVPQKNSTPSRIYNFVSLTENYKNGLQSLFKMIVGDIGSVNVGISLQNVQGTIEPEAKISMTVDASFDPRQITAFLADSDINAMVTKDLSYFSYQKAPQNGGVQFVPFSRNFQPSVMIPPTSSQEVQLKISGNVLYNEACLLDQKSWLNVQDVYGILLAQGSSCRLEKPLNDPVNALRCHDRPLLVRVK